MANNFLNLLKPTAHLSRNGFDLSQKHVFSSKCGQAVPCLALETVPGDKFTIDLAGLMRTMTFNTAAFVRGKFSYDFFFVPNSQLWHPFNQFISQRDDKHSTRQLAHLVCPTIELSTILTYLCQETIEYVNSNPTVQDIHGWPAHIDSVRLLDMLGYGDFRWLIEFAYHEAQWTPDLQQEIDNFQGQFVNIFRLAAYQHIWYDFYRNKYYDVDNTGGVPSRVPTQYNRGYLSFFNFDDVNCSNFAMSHPIETSDITTGVGSYNVNLVGSQYRRLGGMLTLRYCQYKKDLFTSVLPSQQFGAVSAVDLNNVAVVNVATGTSYVNAKVSPSNDSVPNSLYADGRANSNHWNISSAFDVLQLRKAEALQAWKQNTLRAGTQVQDAFRAHYGTESYYEEDNCVKFLGSFDARLDVNTVTAQSAAASGLVNNKVGDLAATGTSVVNGSKISFNPSDFGIIMCIAHYVPDVEYQSAMLDKANRLYEQFDYFTPEFQNIGLEAVSLVDYDNTQGAPFANDVLGYSPHYWMYKTAVDKCHGEFNQNGSLRHWVAPRSQAAVNGNSVPVSNFYINPSFYNSVFGVSADPYQSTDTFLHNVFFDVKAIRPMSELGLPLF